MEKMASRKRVVLVPYPFQGHITPMLQLGSVLDSHGFSITVLQTNFNSPDPSDHPSFTFLPLADGLEGYDISFYNLLNAMAEMNKNCEAPFEEHMTRMLEEEDRGEVACIIYDSIMRFVDIVAPRLKVPTIVLRTNSAAYMHSQIIMLHLLQQKFIPLPESELHVMVPEAYPLRYKDLPMPASQELPEPVVEFLQAYTNVQSDAAVIWNTVESLDRWPLQQLKQRWSVPFFPIGPLHKIAQPSQTSLIEEDNACLSWLDKQSPNSVLFVSLGSLAVVDEEELIDMAWGIAKSEQPFLWVLRPTLLNGSDPIKSLPQEFKEMTRERGCMVKWAPQKKVLAHTAVGGFLTHCGWNSTLEGICEGVPLICRPSFADQMVNSRYSTHEWKVGIEVEVRTGDGYERAVRTLMASEESKMMKQRAVKLKQEIEQSINGGASHESLACLVEFITSLTVGRK
ncbi:UDP-glucose iridoid glucosyltransferase-like [Andrographis paniculata]|uniref:UDP-glucose iridoid glucosyltransferase-like n=1 Tax=Andrographis paniculata TaxID=175694 RepID=UPI0021E929C4|nr:UDP-glucose iridoid glucosyltransferase-like [Andrographis paniculata]